ncbi:UNVERIFIED_CONTAM: hypothetical protein Sindi_1589100 [Sesamum indicum]
MGGLRHRQLTLSFATLAFLLLASVSALGFSTPSRQFSKKEDYKGAGGGAAATRGAGVIAAVVQIQAGARADSAWNEYAIRVLS